MSIFLKRAPECHSIFQSSNKTQYLKDMLIISIKSSNMTMLIKTVIQNSADKAFC